MTKTLALIHTSMVFVNVETMMQNMFAEVMPDVRLVNIVDDSLLADVMATGDITADVQKRMTAYVQAAEKTGADAVLLLCSSLGPSVNPTRDMVHIPVIKIDDPMTRRAVEKASRIGVMATVPTTLGPTVDLIQEKADEIGKAIEIHKVLVKGAFEILMSGDKARHDEMVMEAARELADKVEIIVFAQASMTRLAPQVQEITGLEVLTSPRLAIEYTRQVLDEMQAHEASPAAGS